MSKIKNGGLDQYGAKPFEQQQFGTAGVEGVNKMTEIHNTSWCVCMLLLQNFDMHERLESAVYLATTYEGVLPLKNSTPL